MVENNDLEALIRRKPHKVFAERHRQIASLSKFHLAETDFNARCFPTDLLGLVNKITWPAPYIEQAAVSGLPAIQKIEHWFELGVRNFLPTDLILPQPIGVVLRQLSGIWLRLQTD
jgi:hypothetical protein